MKFFLVGSLVHWFISSLVDDGDIKEHKKSWFVWQDFVHQTNQHANTIELMNQ